MTKDQRPRTKEGPIPNLVLDGDCGTARSQPTAESLVLGYSLVLVPWTLVIPRLYFGSPSNA